MATVERKRAAARPFAVGTADLAWLVAVPCALLVVLAIVLLGEPLGAILFPDSSFTFYASVTPMLLPEPTEQARYLIALGGPVLLVLATLLVARRQPQLEPGTAALLVGGAQALFAGLVAICFVAQWRHGYGAGFYDGPEPTHVVYFSAATLVAAVAFTAAVVAVARSREAVLRIGGWIAESRGRQVACGLVATCATALWLLPAVNFDDTVSSAHFSVLYHSQFTFDEALAVLNDRSPLGDFAVQYGSLWSYALAGGMALLGSSLGTYTILVALVGAVALLAVYALLWRLSRHSVVALLLFLPFLATCLYAMRGPLDHRYAISNLYGTFPMRYAGPLLLAWLTTRHLDGARPRGAWVVFLLGGLVVLNNADFGIPALGASIAALLWAQERPSWRSAGQLALQLAIGLAAALALVSALLLARTGALPDLGLLLRYARIFAVAGFAMLPMPALGVQTVIYLTFVAAIGTATVRAMRGAQRRALTGMLVWSGIFGLGAGSYYVGRSHPEVLTNLFGAWALALVLLTLVAVPAMASRPSGRPTLPELAVLLGLGIAVCSLAQVPLPWTEADRLQTKAQTPYDPVPGQQFVADRTRPDESVAIVALLGHRLAENVGVESVTPYSGDHSMPTAEQLDETVDRLRAAGGGKVFVSPQTVWPGILDELTREGFAPTAQDPQGALMLWVDRGAR